MHWAVIKKKVSNEKMKGIIDINLKCLFVQFACTF